MIERFLLPEVAAIHHDAIFGDFSAQVNWRLASLATSKHPLHADLARLLSELLQEVDQQEYAEIQKKFLWPGALGDEMQMLKFLDAPYWLEGKMRICWLLELHRSLPLRILDLGTGAGHFPRVARFYGHKVTSTDLPESTSPTTKLYAALRKIFGVNSIDHEIKAGVSLPAVGNRFELVTGLMTNFNAYPNRFPWEIKAWEEFLNSLYKCALVSGGRAFFQLTNALITNGTWEYLKSRSEWHDEASKKVLISFRQWESQGSPSFK